MNDGAARFAARYPVVRHVIGSEPESNTRNAPR
jgi:hypothetical protein